jgi:hypothetical protein
MSRRWTLDYSASYTITDPGCQNVDNGIVLNVFRPNLSDFPPMEQVGDLSYCQRASVRCWRVAHCRLNSLEASISSSHIVKTIRYS